MPNTSLIFYYFCIMNLKVSVISKSEELPAMTCRNFFHSTEFFHIIAATPGHTPLMAVACDEEGRVAAVHSCLLICSRRAVSMASVSMRKTLIPKLPFHSCSMPSPDVSDASCVSMLSSAIFPTKCLATVIFASWAISL